MTPYTKFIAHPKIRRSTVLLFIIILLYLARSIMSTILLTFIFSFLVLRLLYIVRRHRNVRPITVVGPLYLLIVAIIAYAVVHYVPVIITQTGALTHSLVSFYNDPAVASDPTTRWLVRSFDQLNLTAQIKNGLGAILHYAGNITTMGVSLFLALLLSFFYTSEIDALQKFGRSCINSPYGWFFADVKYFADKFINTFGVVIETQIFIATVNTLITSATLLVMGMPSVPGLAIMVFLLSLIPVAGAIISVVPLSIVAYTVDGWQGVTAIIVMIIIIHILEAYVLNPKFMASRTQLPILFTFVVLFGGERLFGTWGLIVGLPIFTFFLDILGIKRITATPSRKPQRLKDAD